MSVHVQWEDPPPPERRQVGVAEVLRSRPGKWAIIARYPRADSARSAASVIRHGRRKEWAPSGTFQTHVAKKGEWTCLWVRYLGESGEEEHE